MNLIQYENLIIFLQLFQLKAPFSVRKPLNVRFIILRKQTGTWLIVNYAYAPLYRPWYNSALSHKMGIICQLQKVSCIFPLTFFSLLLLQFVHRCVTCHFPLTNHNLDHLYCVQWEFVEIVLAPFSLYLAPQWLSPYKKDRGQKAFVETRIGTK